jgi:hypothetical protein
MIYDENDDELREGGVVGGQGRSARSLTKDARSFAVLVLLAAVVVAAAWIAHRFGG